MADGQPEDVLEDVCYIAMRDPVVGVVIILVKSYQEILFKLLMMNLSKGFAIQIVIIFA